MPLYPIPNRTGEVITGLLISWQISIFPGCIAGKEVKEAIQQHFRTERSQQLFLKNIKKTSFGFEWKINHRVISKHFDEISGCPSSLPNSTYDKEILFIKGEQSNLITGLECLQKEFPAARLVELPQCGHWIHSEQPEKLAQAIKNFLAV